MPAADGEGDDAGRIVVGVVAVRAGNDLGDQLGAGVQRDPGLRVVVDLPVPPVGGADGGDGVAAGR